MEAIWEKGHEQGLKGLQPELEYYDILTSEKERMEYINGWKCGYRNFEENFPESVWNKLFDDGSE